METKNQHGREGEIHDDTVTNSYHGNMKEDKSPTSNLLYEYINYGSMNYAGFPTVLFIIIYLLNFIDITLKDGKYQVTNL